MTVQTVGLKFIIILLAKHASTVYSFEQKPYCTQEEVSLMGVGICSLKIITRTAQ